MLTLLLMRHAKSSWSSAAHTDHDRPLNGRGRRQAPWVAKQLVARSWSPDQVLSSDARRTRETLSAMSQVLGGPPTTFTRSLYLCSVPTLLAEIRRVPASVRTLLVLGHNPCWEDAASELSGLSVSMTTANVVALQSEARDWGAATSAEWQLTEHLVTPFRG